MQEKQNMSNLLFDRLKSKTLIQKGLAFPSKSNFSGKGQKPVVADPLMTVNVWNTNADAMKIDAPSEKTISIKQHSYKRCKTA